MKYFFCAALVAAVQASEFKVEITELGTGAIPLKGELITADYTGKLLDGTMFDSSIPRGEPFQFTLGAGQVIACWDMGFAELPKGSKAILTCPPELAYGKRGAGGVIPPDATLTFEVQLFESPTPIPASQSIWDFFNYMFGGSS